MADKKHVVDVTAATFEAEVVLRSKEVPVLVDFWATWCGPCRTLTPILEKLAAELDGRFVLAKVDIDANPELADIFRIQSVPSVLLLKGGKLLDGFMGAQPEASVRRFLEPHLPPPLVDELEAVRALEADGQRAEAITALRAALREERVDAGAGRLLLARLLLEEGKPEEARLVFEKLAAGEQDSEEGKAIAAKLRFSRHRADLAALESQLAAEPGDIAARLAYGRALIAAGQHAQGLESLYEAARRDLHFQQDAPRKALIEAFDAVGFDQPLTLEYQRRLSLLLTS